MNYWLITLTFLSVNLDFFVMMLFLLRRHRFYQVLVGYLLGTLALVLLCFAGGRALAMVLPEWVLGFLGFLPLWLAFHDEDEELAAHPRRGIFGVMLTYWSVCAGCNLSLFLPVLVKQPLSSLGMLLLLVTGLTIAAVVVIALISRLPLVVSLLDRFGEVLMKGCYVLIGCYVIYDSGLLAHLLQWW